MSNHSGGYMLNEVLQLLEKESVFEFLGKPKTQEVVRKIVDIAIYGDDCNSGEILEDIGERVGICYCCQESAEKFKGGLCQKCFGEDF